MSENSSGFNIKSFGGRKIGSEAPSPSHEKTPVLRRLESDFPGLQSDEDMWRIFSDEQSGRVEVWRVDAMGIEPRVYIIGGKIDYKVGVYKTNDPGQDKKPALSQVHYTVALIERIN